MTDVTYKKFVKRWEEVTDLPTQTVGPLTPYYKKISKRLKVMPWPVMVIGSLFLACLNQRRFFPSLHGFLKRLA